MRSVEKTLSEINMNIEKLLSFAIIMLVVFLGCDSVDPDPPEVPDEIENAVWPFVEGNEWTFTTRTWNDSIADWEEYGERYEVVRAFLHGNSRVVEIALEYFIEDTVFAEYTFWWGNTTAGLFAYAPYSESFVAYDSPRLLFKYPAENGEDFQSFAPYPDSPTEMFFSSTMPTITVPAGEFEACVGYQYYIPPGDNIYYYFAPDTGYIYMEKYVGSTLTKTRALTEYILLPN